jgi:AcrR family transcriptional regulator
VSRSARTRARLQTSALRLFDQHGYDRVTVEQIAADAGVSAMTFFRHFPTKDAVVLDDPYDPVVAAMVAAQPATLPALERVRLGIAAAWARLPEPDRDETWLRIRIASAHPGLMARMWENNLATHGLIVAALVDSGVRRLEAEVAAGACLGAITAALLDWGRSDDGSLSACITAALDLLALEGTRT